jgi:hypothetical protein
MIAGVSVPFTEKYVSLDDQIYLTENLLVQQIQPILQKPAAYSEYVSSLFYESFAQLHPKGERLFHLFFPAVELLESHWYPRWCRALVDKHELLSEVLYGNPLAKLIVCTYVWTNRSRRYSGPNVFDMGISVNKDVEAETGFLQKVQKVTKK